MKKHGFSAVIAASLAASLLMVTASAAVAAKTDGSGLTAKESKYEHIDISQITGEIVEPPQLSSSASALAKDKAWYEFVYYSSDPVTYYYLTDTSRIAFYDPYDYATSLVMEVDDDITDWSSSNSLSVSYENSSSITGTEGKTTESTSSVEKAEVEDSSTTKHGNSEVITTSEGKITTYNKSKTEAYDVTQDNWSKNSNHTVGATVGGEIGLGENKITISGDYHYSHDSGTSGGTEHHDEVVVEDNGWTKDESTVTSTTKTDDTVVTNTIADRITTATGYSVNNEISMSTENKTTVTKTYDAGYFNESGAPLQWKIVHYTVMMPMRYQVEYLIDGEWIHHMESYCLLKTVQGTCRAWLENNTAYYEHWGTGEPVSWNEFWSSFFTREQVMEAYQNQLYPNY